MNTLFDKRNLPLVILNVVTILVVAIMLVVTQAMAKTEQTNQALNSGVLSYQGTLMDTSGTPVTGSYEMTFRIYNSLLSTTALWEEVRSGSNAVPVQNGLFNVMLGSLNPIPSTAWGEAELFLGVKIGNDTEMSPREKLTVVPGAAVAQMALTIPDGSVTNDKLGADVNNYLIQSGYFQCDWGSCPGWTLNSGIGGRDYATRITFPSKYTSPPDVFVSIQIFDMQSGPNPRIAVYPQNITSDGFDLLFYTWADTIIYSAGASWIAYGTR